MGRFSVQVLGSGDAFSSHARFQASYIIDSGRARILLDPGPSLLAAMKKVEFPCESIDLVLVSHLHGDHFAGLPFLILEYMYESPRQRRLTLAGPPQLEQRTWALFRNMYPESDTADIASKLDFITLLPEQHAELPGGIKVATLRTPHMVSEFSMAYRIETEGKTIAFSGDTGWTEGLVGLAADSDLFLCECTYFESVQLGFHLNYPLLAAQAPRLETRHLLLTHLGREVLERADEVRLPMAEDGLQVSL